MGSIFRQTNINNCIFTDPEQIQSKSELFSKINRKNSKNKAVASQFFNCDMRQPLSVQEKRLIIFRLQKLVQQRKAVHPTPDIHICAPHTRPQ